MSAALKAVDDSTVKSVHAAWLGVMQAVQAVGKTGRNQQQGYSFRGVDATVNAVGPALREHGVYIRPLRIIDRSEERYETKNNTSMRNVTLTIEWEVTGPAGDSFTGQSVGEAADSGDKAVSKAHSVAYRVFLLQALCIPTDEPDPDSQSHERSMPIETPWITYESPSKWLTLIDAAGTVAELDKVSKDSNPFTFSDDDKRLLQAAFSNRKAELTGQVKP